MRIETEIQPVIVEIEDKEYPVAAKTIAVADALRKAEESAIKAGKPQFEVWLAQLEFLLGRGPVKELFPGGKTENLDRMESIYYGVMAAFDYNGREAREARAEETASSAKDLAEALKPLADLMAMVGGKADPKYPTVKRP